MYPISDWQKSSYCAEGNNCVEVGAAGEGTVRLRESAASGRELTVSRAALGALLSAVHDGQATTRW